MFMKNLMNYVMLLVIGVSFAQGVEPKFVAIDNNMIQATYYYDNGQVKQEGEYLNGKLHGKWVSYNEDGTKQTSGEYNQGEKVGTWTFYNAATINKVAFLNSRVASVHTKSKDYLVTK
jgi:antitoxin component YwqK of YwqJK toxin-antitoxin module